MTDHIAVGHGKGEGAGGGCTPSHMERKRKFDLFLEDSCWLILLPFSANANTLLARGIFSWSQVSL